MGVCDPTGSHSPRSVGEKTCGCKNSGLDNTVRSKMGKKKRKETGESLTDCDCGGAAGAGFGTPSTKGQDGAQPAEAELVAVAVEVGDEGAGGLELAQLAGVGRVADGEDGLEPARTGGDGAAVDEGFEAGSSSVGAIAAFADAAERKGRDVQGGVVDCGASGAGG